MRHKDEAASLGAEARRRETGGTSTVLILPEGRLFFKQRLILSYLRPGPAVYVVVGPDLNIPDREFDNMVQGLIEAGLVKLYEDRRGEWMLGLVEVGE